MTHTLNLTRDDPVIHLKAYGGIQIQGVDQAEVGCEIDAPQLVTMVEEEDGHVFITVNSSCRMTVPAKSSIQIERGMGSVKINHIHNAIKIEKVLGNLVFNDISEAVVEKVGGNFAVHQASGLVRLEKVGGNIAVEDVESFKCEKVGGNCVAKNIQHDFNLEKAGGSIKVQSVGGEMRIERAGGSFTGKGVSLSKDLRAGGDICLKSCKLDIDAISLHAGGDIRLEVDDDFDGANFTFRSSASDISVQIGDDDHIIESPSYAYQMGSNEKEIEASAGGAIRLSGIGDPDEDIIGDISNRFDFEESAFSELIRERIDSATRKAEAKMKTAEIRLDQIRERVEKHRGFNVDVDFDSEAPQHPVHPVPPVARSIGKKGATDEERLMILQMLQEKKITVDEAERLFKALED